MSASQPTRQPEEVDNGGRRRSGVDGDIIEDSSNGSSTIPPRKKQPQADPPPPKIPSFLGKEVIVPTTQEQVQAILPTSGAQFEVFANLLKEKLISQD